MTTETYQLANDAYVCLANDLLVFSKLHDDRYCCLNRANTYAALQVFREFPLPKNSRCANHQVADEELKGVVLRALADAGLVVGGDRHGKAFAPFRISVPTTNVSLRGLPAGSRTGIRHWESFLRATIKASWSLRRQPIHRIVCNVAERHGRINKPDSKNVDRLRKLTSIFHGLRPYYPRGYLCRFDSLALIEFLAGYEQYPIWVFGVKSQPFGAHCWVQDGSCVLNDSVDYVSRFTPIMAF